MIPTPNENFQVQHPPGVQTTNPSPPLFQTNTKPMTTLLPAHPPAGMRHLNILRQRIRHVQSEINQTETRVRQSLSLSEPFLSRSGDIPRLPASEDKTRYAPIGANTLQDQFITTITTTIMPIFSDARNTQIASSQFYDYSHSVSVTTNLNLGGESGWLPDPYGIYYVLTSGLGIKKLLEYSTEEAAHDSAARWPPPQCHPGTREKYIAELTAWGKGTASQPSEMIIWVKGPAGVGKSAIAQTFADKLGDALAGSFFFSRPNSRDNPNKFFTTLSHQLAVRFPDSGYARLVDEAVRLDNTIVKKTLAEQFRHLFVNPLRVLNDIQRPFPLKTVIIDGLDECSGKDSQTTIIDIIVNSVVSKTTPFRWLILSRLEPHIVAAFSSPFVSSIIHQIELIISPQLNPEIHRYFTGELTEIGMKRGIEESWPADKDIATLVDISAGLFAHSHALVLFIDDPDSEGPQHQLRVILSLAGEIKEAGEKHPLAALDLFYDILVLKRIPETRRKAIRQILLVRTIVLPVQAVQTEYFGKAKLIGNVLGKTEDQFHDLCRSLHSVATLDPGATAKLRFYHASFMDFMEDKRRSKEECIWSDSAVTSLLHQTRSLLEDTGVMVRDQYQHSSPTSEQLIPRPPMVWHISADAHIIEFYQAVVLIFLKAMEMMPLTDSQLIAPFQRFDFRKITLEALVGFETINGEILLSKLKETGIVRPLRSANPVAFLREALSKDFPYQSYVFGQSGKEVQLIKKEDGSLKLCAYIKGGINGYKQKLLLSSPIAHDGKPKNINIDWPVKRPRAPKDNRRLVLQS
ncbi:hypothetical protein NP233_g7482 [Leucocoprinus birnbaumii]|uniref:Nephrocystin 3-like N-terminal domain-containing protein n=1 Tax=Leucocoprinus birnbaumii TaxID=56174 RepID=A0AAD5VUL5_9AGAR|nr:hypothetical protein NP233_g7482 [Leucocoprinus birnbaumii]